MDATRPLVSASARPRSEKLSTNICCTGCARLQSVEINGLASDGASYPPWADRIIKGSLIPLPLDEQRRIAAILDKADALRRKRKRALELLDGLARSRSFWRCLGTLISNPQELAQL